MQAKQMRIATLFYSASFLFGVFILPACFASSTFQAQESGQTAVARRIGTIKAINGNILTLTPDSSSDIAVTVQANARLLRIPPGAKDLTNATPVQLQDLRSGDRIRVRGQASVDASSIAALEVIVIAHSDLETRHEQERQDWQKRGLGGLVSAVDAASATVKISVTGLGGKKEIAVHTTNATVFRRYAPDSVKFDNAKVSSLQEIQPGDQLRARGARSADGTEVTAEEIVTGSFRNIAGTVNSVDVSAGTLSVQDLLSKKAVQVKATAESQLHKLPPELAQAIAARLKGTLPPGTPGTGASTNSASSTASTSNQQHVSTGGAAASGGGAGGDMRQGGSYDFQQMLSRMPEVSLADLHKGDAVLIVATQGSETAGGTAITLLSGVEPILQAAPSGSQAMMLTPWSLGGAPGGDAGP